MHFCHFLGKIQSLLSDFWSISYLAKKERFRFPWIYAFFAQQITKTHFMTLAAHIREKNWHQKIGPMGGP